MMGPPPSRPQAEGLLAISSPRRVLPRRLPEGWIPDFPGGGTNTYDHDAVRSLRALVSAQTHDKCFVGGHEEDSRRSTAGICRRGMGEALAKDSPV